MRTVDSVKIRYRGSRPLGEARYKFGQIGDTIDERIKSAERKKQVAFNKAVGEVVSKILQARECRDDAREIEKRVDAYLNGRGDLGKPSWSDIPYSPGELMYQAKWRYDRANEIEKELYDP